MEMSAPARDAVDQLRQLADINRVATGYWDWYGNYVEVAADSLISVLQALGEPISPESTVADVQQALKLAQERPWRTVIPPTVVIRQGLHQEVPIHVPHGQWVTLRWITEDGRSGQCPQLDRWVEPQWIEGELVGRATFQVPSDLPLGWHHLEATIEGGQKATATLIVVPYALTHRLLNGDRRVWGVNAQLYSTRSSGSWGVGDSEDLANLVALSADRGADFLLINPVHASTPIPPLENSPYLPVSRRWVNPLYIRPETIPEFAGLSDAARERARLLHEGTQPSSQEFTLIDRDRSWAAKLPVLEEIFAQPRSYHREAEFRHFVEVGGEDLARFALWSALVEHSDSLELPPDLARVDSPRVRELEQTLTERVTFWQWCQWIVSAQLAEAQRVASSVGMDIGVMTDLAVGVHGYGSELWAHPEYFASSMTVGAPPDMYSQQGQNWSQPPWSPTSLAQAGYAPIRDMVRTALSSAGAVRIDHILGLFRLWWIPAGKSAKEGTYVYYDHEAMVGVVLLEAQRAGALVVGEDLGVVEPWVRDYLKDRGVLATSVVWFEKDESGMPKEPHHYRQQCLAAVSIHDLPPTAGYINGIQTTLRDELGLLVDDVESVRAADRREMELTVQRLRDYGLIGENPTDRDVLEALYAYVAQSPARLVVASLVDAVGDTRPQNMPGTHLEYPNWCVPLCGPDGVEISVDDLASNERLGALFTVLNDRVH